MRALGGGGRGLFFYTLNACVNDWFPVAGERGGNVLDRHCFAVRHGVVERRGWGVVVVGVDHRVC